MPDKNSDLHGMAPHECKVALLLIDVINDLEWPEGEQVEPQARIMAGELAQLKAAATALAIPIIYVNDNFGQWRSDFNATVNHLLEDGVRGKFLAQALAPGENDYFVLKPKHSAFFGTTLDILLDYLGVSIVIITGLATNICVLFTANDAYMRDFKVVVPRDCVAANTGADTEQALTVMAQVLKADTSAWRELDLPQLVHPDPRRKGLRNS